MILHQGNIEKKLSLIQDRQIAKPLFTNYYGQAVNIEDSLYFTESSLVLCKQEEGYKRLFVISTSKEDLQSVLSCLPEDNYVLNYPSRKDVDELKDLMSNAGFFLTKTYLRIYNTKIKKRGKVENIEFATLEEMDQVMDLLKGQFVSYLGHLPSEEELNSLINQKNVIVHRLNGKVVGTFIIEPVGKKYYFRAWVDKGNNGLKMLFDAFTIMVEHESKYAYFWVDSENKDVIGIHTLLGAKEDGLKDYIFINRNF